MGCPCACLYYDHYCLCPFFVTAATLEAPATAASVPASDYTSTAPLAGAALLAKVKELGDASKSDLVRGCGYVSTKKDGGERLNFTAFYEALLNAKGVGLGGEIGRNSESRRGRKLSFSTKVQFNGNLMVGKAYTAKLDLKPGDEFGIKINLKSRSITLTPITKGDGGGFDEGGDT